MARQRNPNRDEAKKRFLESDGKVTTKELAESAGVPESRIRKWKSEDNWTEALEAQRAKRKRGGQPGNQNAKGFGAPLRNANAETHGAYSTVYLDSLPESTRALIQSLGLDVTLNMTYQLQTLVAKEIDLQTRIDKLTQAEQEETPPLYVDKVVHMLVRRPHMKDDDGNELEDFPDSFQFAAQFGDTTGYAADFLFAGPIHNDPLPGGLPAAHGIYKGRRARSRAARTMDYRATNIPSGLPLAERQPCAWILESSTCCVCGPVSSVPSQRTTARTPPREKRVSGAS